MFSHVMIGANDVAESKKFYDATLAVLGHKPGVMESAVIVKTMLRSDRERSIEKSPFLG